MSTDKISNAYKAMGQDLYNLYSRIVVTRSDKTLI